MTLDEIGQQLTDLHRDLVRAHPPQILKPHEAAELLGIGVETLWRWRKDGFGPRYSQPNDRIVRYLRDDVVAWLEEHGHG